jgi:hypothetical protein
MEFNAWATMMVVVSSLYHRQACKGGTNEDVEDLYSRVTIGTTLVVLPGAKTAAWRLWPMR